MYVPPAFREDDPEVLASFISAHPLGLLISRDGATLLANCVPFELASGNGGQVLRAHVARANPLWKSIGGQDVLIVFQGANAYVSPQWYAAKREHGKVVPTWNYAMVQVRGRATVHEDAGWLLEQVKRLTARHEASVREGQAWQVSDAPDDYIAAQLKGIVGLEIAVTALTGKFKASQNRPAADAAGVAEGLTGQGGAAQAEVAALVKGARLT